MFKIDFFVSERTLELENSRNLQIMDVEDIIYWCFSVEVNFVISSQTLLLLPEICLFQLVDGLSQIMKKLLIEGKSQVIIDDRYGGFILFLEGCEELILITEQFKGTQFLISRNDFVEGTKDFINSAVNQSRDMFPGLSSNLGYAELVKKWQSQTQN